MKATLNNKEIKTMKGTKGIDYVVYCNEDVVLMRLPADKTEQQIMEAGKEAMKYKHHHGNVTRIERIEQGTANMKHNNETKENEMGTYNNSKDGHTGYVCSRCGADTKQAKQLPEGVMVCSSDKCECQKGIWIDNR
jgi:DNA-directed RNA polymerase subunit RPC12/RpoP